MIIDALLLAEPHMDIVRRINDPKAYLYLTDSILERIEESTSDVRCLIFVYFFFGVVPNDFITGAATCSGHHRPNPQTRLVPMC